MGRDVTPWWFINGLIYVVNCLTVILLWDTGDDGGMVDCVSLRV